MSDSTYPETKVLNKYKKTLFYFILICIPFAILLLIELILRLSSYGKDLNLFVNVEAEGFKQYKAVNTSIGDKYFQKFKGTTPVHSLFLKDKPNNGFRIFVLGSSTVYGFPYSENIVFTKILQKRLQDCYPQRHIEIINTAISAINSYTLLDYIDEILDNEPDAILMYAGHNEFYGAFGVGSVEKSANARWLNLLHLKMLSFKTYQFLYNKIQVFNKNISSNKKLKPTKGTLMKQIVGNNEITYKSKTYNRGIKIFEKNINAILEKVNKKNIPFFISNVVSNVKDLEPFCSTKTEHYPRSDEVFKEARELEEKGKIKDAKEKYILAKDLDCIRFRASEDINAKINELADKYSCYYVNMLSLFENASPENIIGNKLLTEHVHPNIDGYFLMADVFFNAITDSKIIDIHYDKKLYRSSVYYKNNWGYSELDSLVGVHKVSYLKSYWPFVSYMDTCALNNITYYKAISIVDSLAYEVGVKNTINIYDAHLELGKLYKRKEEYYKAFKEYYAAITVYPFNVTDYLNAATCLIHINDMHLALELFKHSLEIEETYYSYYYIGELLYLKGDYFEAIKSLKKAEELNTNSEYTIKILQKLYEIYYQSGDKNKINSVISEIKKINPQYEPVITSYKSYTNYIPVQVRNKIFKAVEKYNSKNYDEALTVLIQTLEVKETSVANRYIGDIFALRNDSRSLFYYLKAYPDFKNDIEFLKSVGIEYLKINDKANASRILNEINKLKKTNQMYTNKK